MITISTMLGIGDCFHLRPIIKPFPHHNLTLMTPWPIVFHDFAGVQFCAPSRNFDYKPRYDVLTSSKTIMEQLSEHLWEHEQTALDNSFPIKQEWVVAAKQMIPNIRKPICLIRPNTLRQDFYCPARNPKTEYFQHFINKYKDVYHFISLASLKSGFEFYDGELKGIDDVYHTGVPLTTVFGLFKIADAVICSPSFWLAIGLALNTNMLCIFGAHAPMEQLTDPRVYAPNVITIQPEPFERCSPSKKNAKKDIELDRLNAAFERVVNNNA